MKVLFIICRSVIKLYRQGLASKQPRSGCGRRGSQEYSQSLLRLLQRELWLMNHSSQWSYRTIGLPPGISHTDYYNFVYVFLPVLQRFYTINQNRGTYRIVCFVYLSTTITIYIILYLVSPFIETIKFGFKGSVENSSMIRAYI